jgi:hypothetical protein
MPAMTGFRDWLGRVIMLVLAGMITLSIIGAIAAIPSGSIPPRLQFERRQWPIPQAVEKAQPPPSPQQPPPEAAPPEFAPTVQPNATLAPAPPKPANPADWLEAITYALLALAGLATFATLLLWRALRQWRRSADALEALASANRVG